MSQPHKSSSGRREDKVPNIRGLVLEGGAAKGSWQFGVLKAFAEAGVNFDVVSGTSVGALNGAVWASHRMDLGDELWMNMNLSEAFKIRVIGLPLLAISVVTRLFYAYVKGFLPLEEVPKPLRLFLSALMSLQLLIPLGCLLVVVGGVFLNVLFSNVFSILCIPFLLIPLVTIYLSLKGSLLRRRNLFFASSLWPLAILLPDIWLRIAFSTSFLSNWLFFFLLLWEFPLTLFLTAVLLRRLNVTIFQPIPLRGKISTFVSEGLAVPLFATVGIEVPKYLDPDDRQTAAKFTFLKSDERVDLYHSAIVPEYVRVDDLSTDDAIEALLSTSALPLGLTPWRTDSSGRRLIDGGVVDNVPWYPLIADFPCREIVIVGCNPIDPWDETKKRHKWKRFRRLKRVVEEGVPVIPRPVWTGEDFMDVPYEEPASWPENVIIIAPERPLGNFITGTLDFSRASARARIEAGYTKGLEVVAQISESKCAPGLFYTK